MIDGNGSTVSTSKFKPFDIHAFFLIMYFLFL
jgi:hypothetical protein